MVDLALALTWIAISAASAKGLTVLARAAASEQVEAEIAAGTYEEGLADEGLPRRYRIDTPADPLGACP